VKRYFSHAWVAGPYQYEYARRLGFAKNDIIFNLLSGDTGAFGKGREYLTAKESNYPRTFLYVGNFRAVKGTDILVDAFRLYRTEYCGDWDLICVGNGEMRPLLDCVPGIAVREFSSQEDLVRLTRQAGVFVLPSRFDQWGVVVHEFAAAGMPLILSENVGASAIYMIEGFNGTVFRYNAPAELARAMHEMSKKSDAELLVMGHNSHTLAGRITPELVAASFLSVTR
jgi:glycosyltransferase involved in cell wall biosynthesis